MLVDVRHDEAIEPAAHAARAVGVCAAVGEPSRAIVATVCVYRRTVKLSEAYSGQPSSGTNAESSSVASAASAASRQSGPTARHSPKWSEHDVSCARDMLSSARARQKDYVRLVRLARCCTRRVERAVILLLAHSKHGSYYSGKKVRRARCEYSPQCVIVVAHELCPRNVAPQLYVCLETRTGRPKKPGLACRQK